MKKLSQNSVVFLDFLRVFSSQLVLIGHALSFTNLVPYLTDPKKPQLASLGVSVFFILSGFLISYTVSRKQEESGNYNFKEYFIERFSRIFSGLLPSLLVILFLDTLLIFIYSNEIYQFSYALNLKTFLGNLFMLQDLYQHSEGIGFLVSKNLFFEISTFGSGRPLWSVSLEWWIYMLYGWLTLGFINSEKKTLSFFILVALAIIPFGNFGVTNRLALQSNLMQTWILGSFIFLAYAHEAFSSLKKTNLFLGLGLFLLSILRVFKYAQGNSYDQIFQILFCLGFMFTLFGLEENPISVSKSLKKMVHFLAGYSYTLYLIHYSVALFLTQFFKGSSPLLIFILIIASSNILAFAVSRLGEANNYKIRNYLLRVRYN